jgi:uncharacterized protein (TIGR02246 family)
MIKLIVCILLTALFQNASSQQSDIDMLTALNRDWLNSYSTTDTATLNKIFADDFVLITPNGSKMSKQYIIANLSEQKISSVKIDSIDVRILTSNVGLITAYTTFVLKADGKEITGRNCYQDVYLKRNKKWMAVAAHVTLLKMQ